MMSAAGAADEHQAAEGTEASLAMSPRIRCAEVTRFDVVFALAAAMAELLVVAMPLITRLPIEIALALHLIVISALGFALYRRRQAQADLTAPLLILIAASTAGPVGGVIGLMALAWLSRPAQPSVLLEAWYNRIALSTSVDPETQLADRIASGRVIDTSAPPPLALVGIVRHGTLQERQAALGLVARFFHMNYLAALSDALRSDVPVIRVQAAAVAARIRPRLAEEVLRRLRLAADILRDGIPPRMREKSQFVRLQLIREIDQAIASQLLDKPVIDAASAMAARLAGSVDCRTLALHDSQTFEARAGLEALEARLIAAGDFRLLRLLRRRRQLVSRGLGLARVRPLRSTQEIKFNKRTTSHQLMADAP